MKTTVLLSVADGYNAGLGWRFPRCSPTSIRLPPSPPWAKAPTFDCVLDLLLDKAGYLGFVLFLALCGMGLPIPEEVPLVAAGVMSRPGGEFAHPSWAFAACLVGALIGDSIMYSIGRKLGHGYLMKHPRFAKFIDPVREEKFEEIVKRHGFKLVLVTRFLIGVRGPVYFAAGAARVPYLRFLMWDSIAATIVVSLVFSLGYKFGDSIVELVHQTEKFLTLLVLAGIGIAAIGWFVHKRMKVALDNLAEEVEEEVEEEEAAAKSTPLSTNGTVTTADDKAHAND